MNTASELFCRPTVGTDSPFCGPHQQPLVLRPRFAGNETPHTISSWLWVLPMEFVKSLTKESIIELRPNQNT
jgi:hypothetical protein